MSISEYLELSKILKGLFISPYAATSLREYFATAFADYYLDSNHDFLKKSSPAVYKKIFNIQKQEIVDTAR